MNQTFTKKIEEKLKNLSPNPGVYLFKNSSKKVIYIGKAINLRNRVRSYFQSSRPFHQRTESMVRQIADFDTILVDSEVEALMLEATLVKKCHPRYNVSLRDDKSYPYIRITSEPYPRIFVTRRRVNDGSKYLGPYTDVKHLRSIIKTARKIFPIRSCNFFLDAEVIEKSKVKLCLDYHINRCQGPCEDLVSKEEYSLMIQQVEQFLKGKTKVLIDDLNALMETHSKNLNYEEAARIRDQIELIKNYYFKDQKVVIPDLLDKDIISIASETEVACAVIFKIRDGKVVNRSHFYLDGVENTEIEDVLIEFIKQYYLNADHYPNQILVPFSLKNEKATINRWLTEKSGHHVEIIVPQIGDKKKLLNLAQKNAKYLLEELLLQKLKRKEYIHYNVRELQKALHLDSAPRIIEGFDISNIQGINAVASLVYFENGKPKKNEYRHFNIKAEDTPDDFEMMREVVTRRYKRLLQENKNLPDLILVDGGKGQLSSALTALEDLGIHNQPIIGLAKRLEEIYLPGQSDPINIPKRNTGLRLLQQIRDETHRFAISHYRKKHRKKSVQSTLDVIPGIGPARKKLLLKYFGSLKKLKEASAEEISEKTKIPKNIAEKVYSFLIEENN